MDLNKELLSFISRSPTAFHAVDSTAKALADAGFAELYETEPWSLAPGACAFVRRNDSSLIAFRVPEGEPSGLLLAAAHSDSPCFKLKENASLESDGYRRLSVEKYGGMLCAPWLDRPLSLAGRVTLREGGRLVSRLVDLARPVALIPNLAIHMDRSANEGKTYDMLKDMPPLLSLAGGRGPEALIAEALDVKEEDILSKELFLYPCTPGTVWGAENEFLSSPRLDDLQCVFGCLHGFLEAGSSGALRALCIFDNEEVGSGSKQGAGSTFLSDVLRRVFAARGLGEVDLLRCAANGLMVSADNAHAVHPNHPGEADRNERPVPNGGVVIKYNAGARYTTDSVSAALFSELCRAADVPVQRYSNRADKPGGSTLGHISLAHLSLDCIDIGLAQLAMHSCYETAGSKDTEYLVRAMRAFFSAEVRKEPEGICL
ncbi:MAG: M18 family aminopeptidase [Oscillospiraceae bacterium]|nr:M18 family aminopeptidase [Oscillospiraceae bacterium]